MVIIWTVKLLINKQQVQSRLRGAFVAELHRLPKPSVTSGIGSEVPVGALSSALVITQIKAQRFVGLNIVDVNYLICKSSGRLSLGGSCEPIGIF